LEFLQTLNPCQPAPQAATYDLIGVKMSIVDIPKTVHCILEAIAKNQQGYVCVTGVHGVIESRDDPKLQEILNKAFLCVPDGMPTVWMGRILGHKSISRVYGPDLMLALMEATQHHPLKHFFYGGAPGVAEELQASLEKSFPGIQTAGAYCPPFRSLNESEISDLQRIVSSTKPDIFWVGLSTPKQERFMAEFLQLLDTKIMIGVGAAFDFHTGRVRQAPRWIRQNGLEWLFRLIQEPKRLWSRYLNIIPRFLWLVLTSQSKTPKV
jgi:N-acetylglucosaminyldiphosphoundecaprenol N-acetyl-beta-D-mannosaminyltransferase